jgi:hypothetical protein
MASKFAIKIEMGQVEALGQKLANVSAERIGDVVVASLNEVVHETYDLARQKMTAGINLKDQYVQRQMSVEEATKSRPVAEITAKGVVTGISHYGAMQDPQKVSYTNEYILQKFGKFSKWPGWPERTGAPSKGIPVGQKVGKMSARVGSATKSIGKKFVIPKLKDTEGNSMVFRGLGKPGRGVMDRNRKQSRQAVERVLGPSVYQLFRFAAEELQGEVADNLEQRLVEEAVRVFEEALE